MFMLQLIAPLAEKFKILIIILILELQLHI